MTTGTDGQEVLLSIIGLEGTSTAEHEAAKIIQVFMHTFCLKLLLHFFLL